MARIRTSGVPTEAKKYMFWGIAAYIRLFKDDGCDESLSVTNQRKIILAFLEDKFDREEYKRVDFYVDDGRPGTTEETRPEFQRMESDIELGKINCVIGKNFSRWF